MKDISGFISDKKVEGDFIIFDTFGSLGFSYSTYRDSNPRVYLDKLPDFEVIYKCFMSFKTPMLKMNRIQDICLSLFYNPYFSEFYHRIKLESNVIPFHRKRFLKKYLLKYLADSTTKQIIVDQNIVTDQKNRELYINQNMYIRSRELIQLLV